MLPDVELLGLDLYTIMIAVGIVAAIVAFRVFADQRKIPAKPFNFFLVVAVLSIACGFLSATLFQSVYDYLESGVWEWSGMTFIGGLAGSVVFFLLLYFAAGHFVFRKKEHTAYFYRMLCCAVPCIVLAHAFGRIGCLFAGCCYGMASDTFGLPMRIDGVWESRVPTQLLESLFLFALFAVLTVLLLKKDCRYTPQIYLVSYGVWRFCIEYLRDDPRGSSGIPFLTPSQLFSLIFIVCGIAMILLYRRAAAKRQDPASTYEQKED